MGMTIEEKIQTISSQENMQIMLDTMNEMKISNNFWKGFLSSVMFDMVGDSLQLLTNSMLVGEEDINYIGSPRDEL